LIEKVPRKSNESLAILFFILFYLSFPRQLIALNTCGKDAPLVADEDSAVVAELLALKSLLRLYLNLY
jgi:hypothetical protein